MDENTEKKAMRLAKYLANAGIASRRRCEELIAEGRITVNGAAVTTPVCLVTPGVDTVCHEGAPVTLGAKEYYIFNKPRGYTCTSSDPHAKRIIYDLLPPDMKRLFYIGRLDRDTEGLLLLTNDGELAELLAHPSHGIQKRYVADCTGSYSEDTARRMTDGLNDAGEFIKARQVQLLRRDRAGCCPPGTSLPRKPATGRFALRGHPPADGRGSLLAAGSGTGGEPSLR